MDAGKLNRWVTIQRATLTPNGSGGFTETWQSVGRVKARAVPVAGKESLLQGGLQSEQPWRMDLRFRNDLTVKDQMRADWLPGRVLTIQSVADPGDPRPGLWLVVFATAVAG